MAAPALLSNGTFSRPTQGPATSHNFSITIPSGTNRRLVIAIADFTPATLKLGTTDLTKACDTVPSTGITAVGARIYYLDSPESAGSTTVTVTEGSNGNSGGFHWSVWSDVDLTSAPTVPTTAAISATVSNTSSPVSLTVGANDIGVILSSAYQGATATAGASTTIMSNSLQNVQGTNARSACGYAPAATPSLTGWVNDQVASAAILLKGLGDTTAPVLTSPVGTQTGSTTATTGATTDEGNGTMYVVVTTSATQPSVTQIKAGQNDAGTAAVFAGNVSVSSTGAKTINATGLTASTAYYAHLVHADAAGNNSNRVTSAQFTTAGGDVTAPVLTSPTGTQTGSSSANVGATTDEGNGTMYAVCSTSNTAPTTTQIQAGQMHTGAAAASSGSLAISSTGAKSIGMSGLSPSTLYYGHVFHRDAAGNASNVVTSASFTTTAGGSFKTRAFYDRLIGTMH